MLSIPNFCSGILRLKYIKISQIVGIFSELKDVNNDDVNKNLYLKIRIQVE